MAHRFPLDHPKDLELARIESEAKIKKDALFAEQARRVRAGLTVGSELAEQFYKAQCEELNAHNARQRLRDAWHNANPAPALPFRG
jgi:hypothetical protein